MNILGNFNEVRVFNEIKRLRIGDTIEFLHTDDEFIFDYSIRNLIKSTVSQHAKKAGKKFKTSCKYPHHSFIVERIEPCSIAENSCATQDS